MKINFTKKQFENLLKLVYLGEWMANAHKTDDVIEKYREMLFYVFSFANEFGFEEYVDNEKVNNGKSYPTRFFEEETDVNELHDEYDDDTFWDELIDRLAHRDLIKEFGIEKVGKMDRKERFTRLCRAEEKYVDEIEKYGIERLGIIE